MIFQNAQELCDSQRAVSHNEFQWYVNFLLLKQISENNFYTEFSVVINGLGVYLIDYRECVSNALVQYSQLIH